MSLDLPDSHLTALVAHLNRTVSHGPLGNAYQRKNRGRLQVLSTGEPVRLLDVAGSDELAQALTIYAHIERNDGEDASLIPRATLLASWGTDGAAHDAEIDLVHGASFSLAASSLRVSARLDDVDGGAVLVGVSVAYYPATHSPTRTVLGTIAAVGGAVVLPVPSFAAHLDLLRASANDNTDVRADFLDRAGAVIARVRASTEAISLPVPNGAANLSVTNFAGVAPVNVRAVYRLAL